MPTHPRYPAITTDGRITRASQISALVFVIILPLIATVYAVTMGCLYGFRKSDLGIFLGMYVLNGLGVTVGYHRLFTHRAFATYRPIRYALALFGCMAAEGAPIIWASQHRQHHASSDQPGDPHSPVVGRKPGFLGAVQSLWHSHYGHVFGQVAAIDPDRYAPDLQKERFLCWMEKWAAVVVIVGFMIPAGIGYAATGTWSGAFSSLIWGGFVRLFAITHATGSVNSICHFFGSRPFVTHDESRNVWWLLIPTLGESWHSGHHAFPTSARHGLRWWEADPSWCAILVLEKVGLASDVIRIPDDRMKERLRLPYSRN